MRAAITNTENLIRSVEPSVSGRTSGSLVTEAQKTRLVGLERAPLDDSFREQSRAFEGETTNINELKRQALQNTQLALTEDDNRENSLRGLYGSLYQREQDDAAKAERDRAFAEQQRQFNEQLAQARRASSSGGLAGLFAGGGGSAPAPAAAGNNAPANTDVDQLRSTAYNELRAMFDSKNHTRIVNEMEAIKKSAGYGNLKDRLKLELLARGALGGQVSPTISADVLANGGSLRY